LYAPQVACWCRRWGVAVHDVGDVQQEVFLAVASHLESFRKERSTDTFRGWLLTIARNKTLDYLRRRGQQPAAAGGSDASARLHQVVDPHSSSEVTDAGDEAVFNSVLGHALDAIRGDFHERTWRAFWGVVIDGRAAADVAADLGMQPGTVRVAKSRVLLRLRRELGDISE
jgi:RNA polymerase sigma-70 factor (ECF subfamily)